MMPNSSQVLDHQLIFYIMYGLQQFHHRQNKGEGRFDKKTNNCLVNIEQQLMAKDRTSSGRELGDLAKKTTAA